MNEHDARYVTEEIRKALASLQRTSRGTCEVCGRVQNTLSYRPETSRLECLSCIVDRALNAESQLAAARKTLDQLAKEQGVGTASVEELERLAGALPDLPGPSECDAGLEAKLALALKALAEIDDLVCQLPSGIDADADPNDTSPTDATAHIGGLISQLATKAIGEIGDGR